jgi:hypothetical protein
LSCVFFTYTQTPPNIVFKRKDKGGINIINAVPQSHMTNETVVAICKEYRIVSADITLRCDATPDQLIDVIEGNRYVGVKHVGILVQFRHI